MRSFFRKSERSQADEAPKASKRRRVLRWWVTRGGVVALIIFIVHIGGCMDRLFFYPQRSVTPPPAGAEGVWFNSADGTPLYGWWIPARGGEVVGRASPASAGTARTEEDEAGTARPTPEVFPTIVHVHGNAGNIDSHQWFTAHLPPAGFNVFIFDYRGYGQSEGRARRRGQLIADTQAAIEAVLARDDVDPKRVGLYGQSLGGSLALPAVVGNQNIRAIVLESPFASWRRIAANVIGGEPPHLLARALAWMLIRNDREPIDAIREIDAPILILHGTDDRIIPHSHGQRLAQAGGEHATLLSIKGGDHNTLKDTHPEVEEYMIDFFRKHLSADGLTN